MKIFQITWTDCKRSWVSATDIIHALQTYCTITDFDLSDFKTGETITELPKAEWGEYHLTDETESILPDMSFAEWMIKYPDSSDVIAETEV